MQQSLAKQIKYGDEVRAALGRGDAVVALESSLIAHGFPRPDNLEIGRALEAAVRDAGAIPATVAVIAGELRVGLGDDELTLLANWPEVAKCSARDLPFVCATGGHGATTVAATARIAAAARLPVFATGGIGGVHRGFERTLDISADLVELARTPLAVVCAGAKTLLDLPATLEVLETNGVPLVGYRCDEFPGFYTAETGLSLGQRVDDVAALARIVSANAAIGEGALVVCQPPPAETAFARADLEALIARALAEADAARVTGGAVTPFVLRALDRLSQGRTRACNAALALANARLAGELAVELRKAGTGSGRGRPIRP